MPSRQDKKRMFKYLIMLAFNSYCNTSCFNDKFLFEYHENTEKV